MTEANRGHHPHSLVLTGFMGTGKTTVGRILMKRGELRWVDTDHLIQERYGRTVATIYTHEGLECLRGYEAELCHELAEQEGLLITTGGGTLLRPEIESQFDGQALIICLTAREDTIACRLTLQDSTRPLFGRDWWQLLAKRQSRYHEFTNQVATDGRHAHQVADEVWALWQETQSNG